MGRVQLNLVRSLWCAPLPHGWRTNAKLDSRLRTLLVERWQPAGSRVPADIALICSQSDGYDLTCFRSASGPMSVIPARCGEWQHFAKSTSGCGRKKLDREKLQQSDLSASTISRRECRHAQNQTPKHFTDRRLFQRSVMAATVELDFCMERNEATLAFVRKHQASSSIKNR